MKNILNYTIIFSLLLILDGCTTKVEKPKPDNEIVYQNQELVVMTSAGKGVEGFADGKVTEAKFAFPFDLAKDQHGTIFLSDMKNHRIRAIKADGTIYTVAGHSSSKNEFGHPKGGFKDGKASEARFNEPKGIAIDKEGRIFVADSKNGAIRVIQPSGEVETLIKGLNSPTDIVVGLDGQLYISDTLNHRILILSKTDGWTNWSVLAGGQNKEVDGWLVGDLKDGKGEKAKFNEPSGLAINTKGNIFVVDTGNQRIRKVTPKGEVTTIAGASNSKIPGTNYFSGGFADGQASEAQFNFPSEIAITSDDTIILSDTYNHRIRIISPDLEVKTIAGTGQHGRQDGPSNQANFDGPTGLLPNDDGSLLVADRWNNVIRKIQVHLVDGNNK